jgi:hypothetical protein
MQQVWRGSPFSPVRMMDSRNPARGLKMSAPFAADDVIYLEGRGGQRVYVVPSRELVVVRQGEIRMDWDDAAFLNGLIGAVPEGSRAFSALLAPPSPDYARDDSWARRGSATGDESRPAAFYIHPTTYSGRDWWNAPHNDPQVNPGVDAVVLGQASVLDPCCDVWAPRYRQASFGRARRCAAGLRPGLPRHPRGVRLSSSPSIGDRPFVILGHSQGALHTQHLVTDVVDPDPALARRLIAAYVIGIPVPEALYATTLSRVGPCQSAARGRVHRQLGDLRAGLRGLEHGGARVRGRVTRCIIAQAATSAIQCTNPLSWQAAEIPVPASRNLGARMINASADALGPPVPGLVGARCDDGALLASPPPPAPFDQLEMMPGSYHFADVALFHTNVARNLVDRAGGLAGSTRVPQRPLRPRTARRDWRACECGLGMILRTVFDLPNRRGHCRAGRPSELQYRCQVNRAVSTGRSQSRPCQLRRGQPGERPWMISSAARSPDSIADSMPTSRRRVCSPAKCRRSCG